MFRVAIIGAGALKGRELKDVLGDRNFPAQDIRLLDDDELERGLHLLRSR
jgi:hypothetical protein